MNESLCIIFYQRCGAIFLRTSKGPHDKFFKLVFFNWTARLKIRVFLSSIIQSNSSPFCIDERQLNLSGDDN
ncbi:MAG: hypothetical protein WBG50_10895, partial [Desulfomonilaceae bacterium]